MAKFLDKKEQVIDFQLTPLGRRKLATGKLKPTFYSFYDDGVVYDSKYADFDEEQNSIHPRIKNNTSYIEGVLSFEEIETSTPPGNYLEVAIKDTDTLPHDYDISPDKNILQTNKYLFDSAIGDAVFEGENTQAAPSWKVVTCQGEILSASVRDTKKYDFTHVELDNEAREFNIPQLEVSLYYTKVIDKPRSQLELTNIPETIAETPRFIDGNVIRLERDDLVVYADEINTQLLTENFDIEVFEIIEEVARKTPSSATVTFSPNIDPNTLLGETITISDSVRTATFEFVADTKNASIGNVGVVVPGTTGSGKAFEFNGSQSTINQIFGAMYNFITAVTNSKFKNDFPTPFNEGTNSTGAPTTNGRCSKTAGQTRCVRDRTSHDLKISVSSDIGSGFPEMGAVPISAVFFNDREGLNGTITTSNTSLFTVTDFTGAEDHIVTQLKRLFFENKTPQVVDGMMVSANPVERLNFRKDRLTEDSVEYYFDVLTDKQVDAKIACECASNFNKNSYYIDLEFDEQACKEPENEVYFDIYGSVTVPEICEPAEPEPCEDDL